MSRVFDAALRPAIAAAARSERIRRDLTRLPLTERVVRRFIPGETLDDVGVAIDDRLRNSMAVSVDVLGEDTATETQADHMVEAYLALLESMSRIAQPAPGALEVSVKLTALGLRLPEHGPKIAEANTRRIAETAADMGVLVTVDAEDHHSIADRLRIVRALRGDFPDLGTVLQAGLRRTEDDCAEFAATGARIRLCKGAYAEPATVAFADRDQIDESYLRCLRILMKGNGYPMVASHDPLIIGAATAIATDTERAAGTWEYQMLYGIRTDEQARIAQSANRIRVYLPYGPEWYGYFMRRLAEKPANLRLFLRALAG
ncbi:proline dehydrogenase family protein [Gordonia sp. ABSL1-1]|uniref:proline dehydrogenase family protein n=1 Tax=Gordonia sp. ABSL1-1 TaxID=3053923 RepID=UPI002573FE63|nr:proline dehydrogenase family protein [Gordonia sp. ABSL1-1]MDL9938003.1 proline dehydrogenase family protein [Gordonia sp. ABSL1-1]